MHNLWAGVWRFGCRQPAPNLRHGRIH